MLFRQNTFRKIRFIDVQDLLSLVYFCHFSSNNKRGHLLLIFANIFLPSNAPNLTCIFTKFCHVKSHGGRRKTERKLAILAWSQKCNRKFGYKSAQTLAAWFDKLDFKSSSTKEFNTLPTSLFCLSKMRVFKFER